LALVETARKSEPTRDAGVTTGSGDPSRLLGLLRFAEAIAVAGDLDEGGVVGETGDEADGARGVGKDGVPVAESEIGRQDDRLLVVALGDDLKEPVGGMGVVGEVAELVDAQELGPTVVALSTRTRGRWVRRGGCEVPT
jgi:hypothetical protein